MHNFQFVEATVVDGVGLIELNRPEVLNAINRQVVSELVELMTAFDRDPEVGAMVVTGKGRAFAAGADIHEMAGDSPIDLELLDQFADWDRLLSIKKPVIGAVNGFALGGGFELALACDLLFTTETAQFGFPEVNLGVMPGAGGTQQLTKIMGKRKALEWLLTGEKMSAQEALHFGVVNRLIAPELLLEETMKYAKKVAKQPPLAVRLIKEAVDKAVDYPLDEGMKFERKNFYLLFSSEDQKEGMSAFMEKRSPQFKGK
ncbi:enoyl-CoA hydratase/isomerase family protein [Pontibacillus sp. ALD_SL1]|uniref:enoyl-CoA hydratase-related protein n=1 Tax=Pontibacillus sp. ALD_SL1 TaxID=2777185 RepID=UPI001A9794AA|nr:enoyl-CoA hydratase-related protein [Pontibacillus sp. ALD_SL1]QSS98878.1 enoyl-CoA hydratase/isomerase family protein [Pontibacillus sp. ALD_SL1]